MTRPAQTDWADIYAGFEAPIARFDCGQYCAPFNDGEPVCCSTHNSIPVVFVEEWQYLSANTDLWDLFQPRNKHERTLEAELVEECRLLECRGYPHCQREYRSLSCRAFPFYPYVTKEWEFIGLAYYWYYEDRCWVISNLQIVADEYLQQFVETYDDLFERMPDEKATFRDYSATARRVFSRWKRTIPLLHRNGGYYRISPSTGRRRRTTPDRFPKHGPHVVEFEEPLLV